jgi:thymidylate kinase
MSAVASAAEAAEERPLDLVRHLLHALGAAEIGYTHWKSTTTLRRAMSGRTDLDLLVDPDDAARFRALVRGLGFKPFISHPSRRYPGVEDFIGLDATSGRLVHLHVYTVLLLGQQYVKNHRLPIERALIYASREVDGIRVPPPELELVILVVRSLLKYRDLDAARDLLRLGRRGGLPPDTLEELRDLGGRVDRREVVRVAGDLVPGLEPDIVLELLAVVAATPRDAVRLLGLRGRVRRALRPYERLSRIRAARAYFAARLLRAWPLSLVTRTPSRRQGRRKKSARGGVVIAVIGVDGAGKSTLLAALEEWLAWRVTIRVVYAGSARPSPPANIMRITSRAVRRVGRRLGGPLRHVSDVVTAVRYLADGWDRHRRLVTARRLARSGTVVFVDRYPIPEVRLDGRFMDGPRIGTLEAVGRSHVLDRLRRAEERIYRRIPRPDHVIVLQVRAETARTRKVNRLPESVSAKAGAIAAMDRSGLSVLDVDAERPFEEVLADVKQWVWERL